MTFSKNALPLAIGALALAILTTGTAVAATGSLVNIVDPVTKAGARVDLGGKLRVGDGSGPLTVDGTVRTVAGGGTQAVTGTVNAVPALPAQELIARLYYPTQVATMKVFGPFPANRKLAITSFSLTNDGNDPIQYGELSAFAADASCTPVSSSVEGDYLEHTSLMGHSTTFMSYPTPLVVPSRNLGTTWCLFAFGNWSSGGNVSLYFNVVGHLV